MKSFAKAITLILLTAFLLPSCKSEHKYKIGVSQCSDDAWRSKMNDEIMREVLFHDNLEVEIRSADDSNEKQKADLRHFVAEGCDLIIAAPNEASALTPILDSIYTAGIPVIIIDRGIDNDHYTAFQCADNYEIGRAAASYARTLAEKPRVLEVSGNMRSTPARQRSDGFHSVADSDPSFTILASAQAGWTLERSLAVSDSLLKAHPDVNIIYAHNDNMAIGAAQVARRLGRDDIKIIGIDASPQIGIQAVVDSVIDATFVYPTEGRRIIGTAMAILEGKPYQKEIIIPANTAVDQSNADIMLAQHKALKVETDNIKELKSRLDIFWQQHRTQTWILIGAVIILLLSVFVLFLLLRGYWEAKRHRAEIELRNEQLKEATQSKLSFFTSVSHDLRTPLTLIAEPVEQLAAADNLSEKQRNLIRLADKNVKILKRLINQILDFRKYENGKLSLNLSESDLSADVKDWTEAFHELARRKHIKFKVSIPDTDSPVMMAIDKEKMERVLFNLLSNSFKFTPANGTISVALAYGSDSAVITVADNGKGIPAEDIDRIFDNFFKTEKVNSQGSGIGLALCKAFVEMHGGSISVESSEGAGSSFTVTIPVRHTGAPTAATEYTSLAKDEEHPSCTEDNICEIKELEDIDEPDVEPNEADKSILVIDDNADIRTLVASLLQQDYNVIQAANGPQGIRLATKYVPDLVICDVMMPGMDGFETCSRIKGETSTSHIPVLLLTACAMDEQKICGYGCGADAYVTKPFNAKLLTARIDALLKNRESLQRSYAERLGPASQTNDGKKKPAMPAGSNDVDNEFYERFMMIVDKNIDNSGISVDDIASTMGLSRVQLYRKLKAITNYSPTDLLKIRRLKLADKMLKTSDVTVSEVSYSVGFSSHSYFTKCYREYFGESPSDVQKRTAKIKS